MKNWIDDIKKLKIIVLGDLMLDRYIIGSVERVSPEAPVPILAYEKTLFRLGGAANVALNLSHLGAQVFPIGVLGTDPEGSRLIELCKESNLTTQHMLSIEGRPTTQKTRYMADDQHLLRVDKEATDPISNEATVKLLQYMETIISTDTINLLIFQDYDKGVISRQLIDRVTELCRNLSIQILVDPKFNNFWNYRDVDLFKPNLKECSQALNTTKNYILENRSEVDNRLRKRLNHRITLMTLGEDGIYISDNREGHYIPGTAVDVADVCGAGDTVISVAACALGCGLSVEQIAAYSNQAAAWACTQPGVISIDAQRLKSLVK